jgi:hypothetical protein
MEGKFEHRLQELLDIYKATQQPELARDDAALREKLKSGLSASCELLRFMVSDTLRLKSARPEPNAWRGFQLLVRQNRFDEFLDVERKILVEFSDLRPDTVETLVLTLRQVIHEMIQSKGHLEASWVLLLDRLAHDVCTTASAPKADPSWRPFLKRACLAGVGGLVTVGDLGAAVIAATLPEPELRRYSSLLRLSVGAGTWLIGWAATLTLDKLIDISWSA